MKGHGILFPLLTLTFAMFFCSYCYADDQPFKLKKSASTETKVVNETFVNSDSISFSSEQNLIEGFSITGRVIQTHPNSFVRVLLEDESGKKHLVLESNKRYNDVDTLILVDYCEETKNLMDVRPVKLLVFLRHASLELSNTCLKRVSNPSLLKNDEEKRSFVANMKTERTVQLQSVVEKINQYNRAHRKLWVAGVTSLSMKDYETRQRILGFDDATDTDGFEYYVDGIIDIGGEVSSPQTMTRDNASCVSDFDWRDRHGKNWMTTPQYQGGSGYCTAFATCGMLEARTNLYYNQKIDLNLSEQDIVYNYARAGYQTIDSIYKKGMLPSRVLGLAITDGVLDEASVPFIDAPQSVIPPRPTGNENIRISNKQSISVSASNVDVIKRLLIQNGPMISGIWHAQPNNMGGHAMTLVGYHVINEGDTIIPIKIWSQGGLFPPLVVGPGNEYIGQTYWVFKDSYGPDAPGRHHGYYYALFTTYECMRPIDYTTSSITSLNYTDDDIVCEDLDGDGFYNWGIGPKPAHCPSWVPDTPDGDDSDYEKGPMDAYGYLMDIPDAIPDSIIYITQNTVWSNRKYVYHNVYVNSGKTLRITNDINFYRGVTLNLASGSKLIVDGATLTDVDINYIGTTGTSIQILNNGAINYVDNQDFVVPLGVTLDVDYGKIN